MDKIATIYSVSLVQVEEIIKMMDIPGNNQVCIKAPQILLKPSSVEYSEEEEEAGSFFKVELKIKLTDTSFEAQEEYRKLSSQYLIILLYYSNGIVKVVGSKRVPVRLAFSLKGNPTVVELSFKENLPEKSKIATCL